MATDLPKHKTAEVGLGNHFPQVVVDDAPEPGVEIRVTLHQGKQALKKGGKLPFQHVFIQLQLALIVVMQ